MIDLRLDPSRRELRQFAVAFAVFAGLLGWLLHGRELVAWSTSVWIWRVGGAVGLVGVLLPVLVRPIYVGMMVAAFPIGWVLSHVLLGAVFYLLVTPIGLGMRLVGYDPLRRTLDPDAGSYWSRRSPVTDLERYFRQY